MTFQYQVILLGDKNTFIKEIQQRLFFHIAELGLNKNSIIIIEEKDFLKDYQANAPAFCLYFGSESSYFKNLDFLDILIKDATLILPIVNDLKLFKQQIPKSLENINAFELASKLEIEKLISSVLEGLNLLRLSRRLFISYKRDESSLVAIQLFEKLEKSGFDVFLDTHSIRPGDIFQEELWHRLADTDIVVLLNTPGFLKSNWTTQELAKANSMSIGILQLIWPTHTLERDAEISIPYQLSESDFGNNNFTDSKMYLTGAAVDHVTSLAESLRARSLAARQDNLISEFISFAKKSGKKADLQSEKFLTVRNSYDEEIIFIPTVGVPQAFTYNQSEELIRRIKSKNIKEIYLLYDHINIREKWIAHLAWLDNYLPVKTKKIIEIEEWLKKI